MATFVRLSALLLCLFSGVSAFGQSPGSDSCVVFDGVDNYVQFDDSAAINDGDFTVEFWFSPNTATWSATLLDLADPVAILAGDKYFFIDASESQIRFWFESDNDADVQITAPYNFTAGEWYHVAAVGGFSRTENHRLYVNGVEVASSGTNTSPKPNDFSPVIRLGLNQSLYLSTPNAFNGQMDEFRIWSSARSENQIREYMCQELIGTELNLERYYRFDSESTNINDFTNSQNATLVNANVPGDIITSSAPIGDESIFDYNIGALSTMNLAGPNGDDLTITISSFVTAPVSVHVYRVDEAPNTNTANNAIKCV